MLVVAAHSSKAIDLKLASQLPVKSLDLSCWINCCVGAEEHDSAIVEPLRCPQLNAVDRGRLQTCCASTLAPHITLPVGKVQTVRSYRSQIGNTLLAQCRLEIHAGKPVVAVYLVPHVSRNR